MSTEERARLEEAIAALEALRNSLGDDIVDSSIAAIREKLAALEPSTPDESRKQVTMLFADLAGWTKMSEKLDPEEVWEIQDLYFSTVTPSILAHGGSIEKYIGDAILAVFGVPKAREDDPERAVRAALKMQEDWKNVRESAKHRLPRMRIGIHTGLVVASLGEEIADFIVTGDTVNLAARLESAAPPGGILISHATYQHVQGLIDVETQEPLSLKGKSEPVQAYEVLRLRPHKFQPMHRDISNVQTQMVGREAELARIQEVFNAQAKNPHFQIVTILGVAGIGKSRLLAEFRQWAMAQPKAIEQFEGRAVPETQRRPYGLLREIFTSRYNIQEADTLTTVRRKLEAGILTTMKTSPAENELKSSHLIGQLLGFDFLDSPYIVALLDDPQEMQGQSLIALANYFRTLAEEATVFILLEDLHWADRSSLDALSHLAKSLSSSPILIVGASRPDFIRQHPAWGQELPHHQILRLMPLAKDSAHALVEEILQRADEIPPAFKALVVQRSDGNPFYIEELLKMFIEDGVINVSDHHWHIQMDKIKEVQVPPTLTGVLQARLDLLDPGVRSSLQQASVVGRYFWDRALEYIQEQEETRDLDQSLETLQEREFIFQNENSDFAGAREYLFRHALLRDVTYENLLKRLRRIYHGLAANWLIGEVGDRVLEFSGQIADHLELAGRTEEAVDYMLQAGDQARNLYSHSEAIDYYKRALKIQEAGEATQKTARTLMKLGQTLNNNFQHQAARDAYQKAFELWRQADKNVIPHKPAPHALRMISRSLQLPNPLNYYEGREISVNLFSGLVQLSPELDVLPDVAYRWDVTDSGRRYIFHLQEDSFWTDGVPVTAEDFVYTLTKILDPATTSTVAGLYFDIKGARALNQKGKSDLGIRANEPHILEIELEEPSAYFLQLMAILLPVPRHALLAYGNNWNQPENLVSNGAFRLASWQPGEEAIFVRNKKYHGAIQGNLDQIRLIERNWPPKYGNYEMYASHLLDILDIADIPTEHISKVHTRHIGELVSAPEFMTGVNGFNTQIPPFDQIEVRQAFALTLDQERMVDTFWANYVFPGTGGLIPLGMPGHSPGIGHPFDPEKARNLLAKAGYPDGADLPEIVALCFPGHNEVSDFMYSEWKEHLSVDIVEEIVPFPEFVSRLSEDPPQMWIGVGIKAEYPDPDNFLRVQLSRNDAGWRNERYEDLISEAKRMTDQKARLDLYAEADRILMEETILIPFTYSRFQYLLQPWVKRFPISPIQPVFWKDVIIDPD